MPDRANRPLPVPPGVVDRLVADGDAYTPPDAPRPKDGPSPPGLHRLTINIPAEMFERLRRRAFEERRSITEIVVAAIAATEQRPA